MDNPPSRFTDDLAAFFDRHPLAESATFTAASGGQSQDVICHFYSHDEKLAAMGINFETTGPKARCKESDTGSATKDSVLLVRAVPFHVLRTKPSNAGTMWLELSSEAQHG